MRKVNSISHVLYSLQSIKGKAGLPFTGVFNAVFHFLCVDLIKEIHLIICDKM